MPPSADLTFLHLSDIHFRKDLTGTPYDPDIEIRDRLEFDLRRLAVRFGDFSGIIITGDVAWSGHKKEYDYATSWIRQIAGHLRCDVSTVMVIPGNHDVDRRKLLRNRSKGAKLQRKLLGKDSAANADSRLSGALTGQQAALLTAPIAEYNRFAKQFNCAIKPAQPYWQRKFQLGDGTTLLVRGITSTWLSGPEDSEKVATLLYGSGQYTFAKLDKTYYIAAAHHPPRTCWTAMMPRTPSIIIASCSCSATNISSGLQARRQLRGLYLEPCSRIAEFHLGFLGTMSCKSRVNSLTTPTCSKLMFTREDGVVSFDSSWPTTRQLLAKNAISTSSRVRPPSPFDRGPHAPPIC